MTKPSSIVAHPLFGPLVLLGLLTLVALQARPLTPIDETRYIGVAWEMWQRNDYLVLFRNGAPYSHKPPMLFWLYNLGWAVTGVNEWWPRLVSPLFSLGGLLLTQSLARRLWPAERDTVRNALWVLSSCLLWLAFSTFAMFDVMLAFFALLGMRGLLIAAEGSRKRGFAWLALAIGCGVLAKGPVILLHLLPVAVLAPWWRQELARKPWYGGVLLAVLGGAAIALLWAIPAAIQGGAEYRRMIFWGQTANRMVDSFAHQRPLWWYVPLLPLMLFPWLLWPALWRGLAALRRQGLDNGLRFCLSWMAPVFIAFTLISGKQMHYMVPLVPAFALMAGRLLARSQEGGMGLPVALSAALGAAMAYFAVAGLPGKPALWQALPWWPGALLILAAALAAWLGKIPQRRMPALAMLAGVLLAMVQFYFSDSLWRSYDISPMAREIRKLQDRGIAVANDGEYHAQYQFAGRLQRPLDALQDTSEIGPWFERHPNGAVVLYKSPKTADLAAASIFSQPYRGEFAILVNADQARALGYLK